MFHFMNRLLRNPRSILGYSSGPIGSYFLQQLWIPSLACVESTLLSAKSKGIEPMELMYFKCVGFLRYGPVAILGCWCLKGGNFSLML